MMENLTTPALIAVPLYIDLCILNYLPTMSLNKPLADEVAQVNAKQASC